MLFTIRKAKKFEFEIAKILIKPNMKKLFSYFLQGILFTAPLGITFYIIYVVFKFIDGILMPFVIQGLGFKIPGLGVLLILVMITLVGVLGQSIVAAPVKSLLNRTLKRLPLLQMVYSSVKDFLSAFVGKEKRFTRPVMVKMNDYSNLERLGFITEDDISDFKALGKVAVYFPHSLAFSGELYVVPMEAVTPLDLPPAEAMKFIVSAGIARV